MLTLIYGGTFDPVHRGHIAVARAAASALHAEVRLMPAADPPHREAPHADGTHRARMLELALADERALLLDRRELQRGGPSYTIQTVLELRDELGDHAPIGLLLGADALLGFHTWRLWRELLAMVHLVVANRPGHSLQSLPEVLDQALEGHWTHRTDDLRRLPAGRIMVLEAGLRDESSTQLRERLRTGGDWAALVPEAVADYIRVHRLYGC